MNNIFDTHSHYAGHEFDEDRDLLFAEEFPKKGIKHIMVVSTDVDDIVKNSIIAQKYDYVYSSAGIHPENVENNPDDYIEVIKKNIASNPKIKAIGEIGLDYHYEGYDREKQIKIFKEQLELANELNLPVIIHSRDATEDTLKILKEYKPSGVMHCFSGSAETAKEIIKLGMYIGFTGVITFKNAKKAIKALEVIPLERLVLETDCPYMAPVPFRGKRCDSSMIEYTAIKASEVKGIGVQELIDITCENGKRLFRI